jgi:hypothetical protein
VLFSSRAHSAEPGGRCADATQGPHDCDCASIEPGAVRNVVLSMPTTHDTETPRPRAIDLSGYNEWHGLVVRADSSDDVAWHDIVAAVNQVEEFGFSGHFIDDPAWHGASVDEILSALPPEPPPVLFIADAVAMAGDHPLLAVRTWPADQDGRAGEPEDDAPRQFRLLPGAVAEVHGNLDLANMDFEDYSAAAGKDPNAVFRGLL